MDNEGLKDVITFGATVDREVEQDSLSITFQVVEHGQDANKVQAILAVKLSEALAIARQKKVDGEVDIESGNFRIGPTYNKKSEITGYNGYVQMTVSGTDTKTISALTGEITTMTVASVSHSISPVRRKKIEEELTIEAIKVWTEKGNVYARAFGAQAFTLINSNVGFNQGYPRGGGTRAMAFAASASATSSYDDEAGKETLTASVSGTIQLIR